MSKEIGPRERRLREQREARFVENESRTKATKGKTGMAVGQAHVRRSTAGTGLRVGEADAVQPATSEIMDVTAGETVPNSSSGGDEAKQAPTKPRRKVAGNSPSRAKPAVVASSPPEAKRGRGRPKVEGQKPWESAGMSKASWYRRKKK